MKWLALVLTVVTGAGGVACAAETTASAPAVSLAAAQQLVTGASHGAAKVERVFAGPDGMTGAVIAAPNGAAQIVWLTPHAQALFTGGGFYGMDGRDLTQPAMVAQGLLMAPAAALSVSATPATRPITVGTRGPVLTAFVDANCIYCHELYKALQPDISAGRLRVRYVLVGVVKSSSLPRAAAILAAKDPAAALARDEAQFNVKDEEGGYPPDATMDAAAQKVVEANNALFAKFGATGTPTLLYCTTGSDAVAATDGMPQDVPAFVAKLASGPAKECGAK